MRICFLLLRLLCEFMFWWASAFLYFHSLTVRKSVGRASWLFVKHPHLNAMSLKGKTLRKKILPRAQRRCGDFFSANPQGLVLTTKGLFRNLLTKKSGGNLYAFKEDYENTNGRKYRWRNGTCSSKLARNG